MREPRPGRGETEIFSRVRLLFDNMSFQGSTMAGTGVERQVVLLESHIRFAR